MKKILCSLTIFLFPTVSLLAGISGTYSVCGFDPNVNQSYTGEVIIEKQDDVYVACWTFNDGSKEIGTGLKTDCEISFVFEGIPSGLGQGDDTGVQVYKICHDKLKGPWVLIGSENVGFETLKKIDDNSN